VNKSWKPWNFLEEFQQVLQPVVSLFKCRTSKDAIGVVYENIGNNEIISDFFTTQKGITANTLIHTAGNLDTLA